MFLSALRPGTIFAGIASNISFFLAQASITSPDDFPGITSCEAASLPPMFFGASLPDEVGLASRHVLFEVRLLNPRLSGGDRLRWGVFSLKPLCLIVRDRWQCFCRFAAALFPRSGTGRTKCDWLSNSFLPHAASRRISYMLSSRRTENRPTANRSCFALPTP